MCENGRYTDKRLFSYYSSELKSSSPPFCDDEKQNVSFNPPNDKQNVCLVILNIPRTSSQCNGSMFPCVATLSKSPVV